MAGNKTHEQHLRILEKRVDTSNAGDDFDAKEELRRPSQERKAHRGGAKLRDDGVELTDPDDRSMIRGVNQESKHHKRRADH
jgi:hypothetical protein